MDLLTQFRRECLAFEAAARRVTGDAPLVPSCPEWTMSDLVAHLGWVQRYVTHVVTGRHRERPDVSGQDFLGRPPKLPMPDQAPNHGPIPAGLVDWFAEGAAGLAEAFASTDPGEPVWTWSAEQTAGFWLRMQAIEAAVHRWDAENALGTPRPIDTELAADAIQQHFEVMAPFRRAMDHAPAGNHERFRFRQTDGPGDWTVHFHDDTVELTSGPADVELAGTASDLMLSLWRRLPQPKLDEGRYFTLVPPG